jgi:hypothetical protein
MLVAASAEAAPNAADAINIIPAIKRNMSTPLDGKARRSIGPAGSSFVWR